MSTRLLLLIPLFCGVYAQEELHSAACKSALEACENDLECSNRLAPLMAACSTGTCQPQCRNAVLNVYQNKLGRTLLRSDATCVPGRDELRTCNFLPTGPLVHCSLAKLACEADLQCNSKWGVFVSECESESARGECSARCSGLLSQATQTPHGAALLGCTCTQREDNLCVNLKDNLLGSCTKPTPPPPSPSDNSVTSSPSDRLDTPAVSSSSTVQLVPTLLLCALLAIRMFYMF